MLDKAEIQMQLFGTTDRRAISSITFKESEEIDSKKPEDWREWVKTDFPYYAPESELPAPLPSMDQIVAARGTENDLTKDRSVNQYNVYRLGPFAVKFAIDPSIFQEAENLLFLQENCEIRVPKLYAAFSHQGADPAGLLTRPGNEHYLPSDVGKYYYLITEYIPGRPLGMKEWMGISLESQDKILQKIGEQLRLLRAVPPPEPGYYGRVYHQGFFPDFPQIRHSGRWGSIHGPFDSHEDWVEAIYKTSLYNLAFQARTEFTLDQQTYLETFQEIMARAVRKEPVLTHCDLKEGNFIVQEKADGDYDVVIIDWAWMGWMPAYMELTRALFTELRIVGEGRIVWDLSQDSKLGYLDIVNYLSRYLTVTSNAW